MLYQTREPIPIGSFDVEASQKIAKQLLPGNVREISINRSQITTVKDVISMRFDTHYQPPEVETLLESEEHMAIQNPFYNNENYTWHVDGWQNPELLSFRWGASSGRTESLVGEIEFPDAISELSPEHFNKYIRSRAGNEKIYEALRVGSVTISESIPGVVSYYHPGTIHRGNIAQRTDLPYRFRYKHWGDRKNGLSVVQLFQ